MIPFVYSKLSFKNIRIKKVSGVQEGRVSYLDPTRSVNGKEVFTHEKVPGHVSNAFGRGISTFTKKSVETGELKEKIMRVFLRPVTGSIGYYGDLAITLERHPLGNMGDQDFDTWSSFAEDNFEKIIKSMTATGKWYIDGSYIYRLKDENPTSWQPISVDGRFRQVEVEAIRILDLSKRSTKTDKDLLHERVCIAYVASNGKKVVSPPIWKDLVTIGKRIKQGVDDVDIESDMSNLSLGKRIDNTLLDILNINVCVNLSFVLKAGKSLANVFGYDAIEPLNLPELMLKLKTVNLPNVHLAVKSTFDSGVSFQNMTAWLLGLLGQVNTIQAYLTIRSLLKYLSGKGLYYKEGMNDIHIFRKGYNIENVPLKSIEEARSVVRVAQAMTEAQANTDSRVSIDYTVRNVANLDDLMDTSGLDPDLS